VIASRGRNRVDVVRQSVWMHGHNSQVSGASHYHTNKSVLLSDSTGTWLLRFHCGLPLNSVDDDVSVGIRWFERVAYLVTFYENVAQLIIREELIGKLHQFHPFLIKEQCEKH